MRSFVLGVNNVLQASGGRAMAFASPRPVESRLLVVSAPDTPELKELKNLPKGISVVGAGKSDKDLKGLSEEDWRSIDALLVCGVGSNAGGKAAIQELWPRLPNLRWIHSAMAGLEHIMFPALVDSPVVITNARGSYSHSLAEFALAGCSYFAKNFSRLVADKAARRWEPFEVEELRNRTLGIVGYGDIGQATARLARAFGMRIIALRRRTQLSAAERDSGLQIYPPERLNELMAASDYVVAALPHTPATDKLINAAAIGAMRPNAVFVNIGRGKTVDETALVEALRAGRIRGAALDVFETEPLPKDSPLYDLPNVLMSPHCADRTVSFQDEALQQFVGIAEAYVAGRDMPNVVDKRAGY